MTKNGNSQNPGTEATSAPLVVVQRDTVTAQPLAAALGKACETASKTASVAHYAAGARIGTTADGAAILAWSDGTQVVVPAAMEADVRAAILAAIKAGRAADMKHVAGIRDGRIGAAYLAPDVLLVVGLPPADAKGSAATALRYNLFPF